MKIKDIQVDGFGVWKGLTIEELAPDVTVFYGQNEAGKTTLMQFIRTVMFGFSPDRQEKYVPPVYGGLAGGSIEVQAPSGCYEIGRHIDPHRPASIEGDLSIIDTQDGSTYGRAKLAEIMGDVDESIFNNVFAIGLKEIQELGALNSTDASELLYRLTSGLDRVSLVDVMRQVAAKRERLLASRPDMECELKRLSAKRAELVREIEELRARSKRWSRIAVETNKINRELKEIETRRQRLEAESRRIELAIQIADRWNARKGIEQQIEAFGTLPDPRDVNIEQLDSLNQQMAACRERLEQIKAQRAAIKAEARELPINRRLWNQRSRVDALTEHLPWVEALQRQVKRLKDEIDTLENTLSRELSGLGDQLHLKLDDVRALTNRSLQSLKSTARRLHEQRERLKRLKDELEKTEFDLGQHQERLNGTISEGGGPGSLDETTRYVNRLRRRIELEQKIEKLNQARHELEREIDDIVNEQVLPVGKLSAIGLVFIIGTILVGFGLIDAVNGGSYFGQTSGNLGFLMMLMGAVCGFIAMALKYHWERVAKEDLEDFRHQMEVIRQQLKRAKSERDEIDRQLPSTITDYALELADAENHLARLEGLVPLEKRVHSVRSTLEDLRRRVRAQQREVEECERSWREQLKAAGLPTDMEPLQLKEILKRSHRIDDLNFRIEQHRHELEERKKELDALHARIDGLLNDCGIKDDKRNIIERLNRLNALIQEQRSLVATRKELAAKYRRLRTKGLKVKRELESLQGQKQRLLSQVGAADENEFRQLRLKLTQRDELIARRNNLTEQIQAAIGKQCSEAELAELLENFGQGGLEKRWEEITRRIDELKQRHDKLVQQRGELLQEIKSLGEDRRLDEARLELNCLEAEIAQQKLEWQTLATCSQMLEAIREKYELKRQPEALREASGYLQRLTEGQYTRIWTRMIGEELLCDNANEETITVDRLSRGTREAVYLSLRLALIGAYARRGAVLPMVLDDVLVNFDARRTRAAAELLCDFSQKGYQLLMFTCHEHMAEVFDSLNATVKCLPHHRDVYERQAVPTDFRARASVSQPVVAPLPVVETEPVSVVEPPVVAPMNIVEELPEPPSQVTPPDGPPVDIVVNGHDAELEFELSEIERDRQATDMLRNELVYVTPTLPLPVDLSGDDPIWNGSRSSVA